MAKKVLLIGWDAADWKAIHPLMDAGRMPHLQRLVERGAMGRIATLHPPLSPMLWTSIATGKRPWKHGIHGFSEPTPDGRGIRPITNLSRTCKAVWNILNQNDVRSTVIGWWPSHPAEPLDGIMVSDHYHKAHRGLDDGWPLIANSVHPPELHDTLAELRLHPQELMAPMLVPFLPALEKVDQEKDKRFSMLCRTIAECAGIHSAATWLMDNQPWDFFAVYYDAIDHFCHGFMKYHPPRRKWIGEEDFELYSNVINTAYQFHDQMLGTLLAKAGEDTTVILMSDHGFHPDHLRPSSIPDIPAGPAAEHSPFGIFVIAGPGIRKDTSLFGLSVLDLTPTVLTLYGLPVGADMDGKTITQAFENPPDIQTISSWEDVPGKDGRHPPDARLDPVAAAEAMEQLVALGYIEKPGPDAAANVESTVRELRYNLIEAYHDSGMHSEALELARDLCRRDPDEQRYALKRFISCQALGLTGEMREIVDDMRGRRRGVYERGIEKLQALRDLATERYREKAAAAGREFTERECALDVQHELSPDVTPVEAREPLCTPEERKEVTAARRHARYIPAIASLLEAQTLVAERRFFEALDALIALGRAPTIRPGILLQGADLFRRLGRLDESEAAYRRALAADPDNVQAHLGICRIALRRRQFAEAECAAAEAVGRLYFFPLAHFLRSFGQAGLGDYRAARESLETALSQNPHFPQAHLRLARLLKFRLGEPEAAKEHFAWYRQMRRKGAAPKPTAAQAASGPTAAQAAAAPLVSKPGATAPQLPLPPLEDGILVVSGLPRSGTSMLMQMLAAGGMPLLTDSLRAADEDNPRGYFEFEPVRTLYRDRSFMVQAKSKAVKIVAPLVCSLPPGFRYRVILLDRDLDEILASQATMMDRRGATVSESPGRRERLVNEYARVLRRTRDILTARGDVEFLELSHRDALENPAATAAAVAAFAGVSLDVSAMARIVDRALHRNRA